ncbi:hypothetical protein [Mycolicibacterium goodii]
MADQRSRYPGAHPFTDDDHSRRIFCGRDDASRDLTTTILANHTVTVHARAGAGKTSLLLAGVSARLRESGFLPLYVRLTGPLGPLPTVIETIPCEAQRQHVDYAPGHPGSLWTFFKTAQFSRGGRMLTPVLILDQFEDLFTLHSEPVRMHFLHELGYLTRGLVPPPGQDLPGHLELSAGPPAVKTVLSVDDDHLDALEEAAEPELMGARYRVPPLDRAAARAAIIGPAAVNDPVLTTGAFAVDEAAVTMVLDHLSRPGIEPFHVQLVGRRMEVVAGSKKTPKDDDPIVTISDLGGPAGVTRIFRDVYRTSIESLGRGRDQRAARRLCEEHLISPLGRRLSVEVDEIRRQFGLPVAALDHLVSHRLLHAEKRSGGIHYELTHDALVDPVLESRRTRAAVAGTLGIAAGVLLMCLSAIAFTGIAVIVIDTWRNRDYYFTDIPTLVQNGIIYSLAVTGIFGAAALLFQRCARSRLRYRYARRPAATDVETWHRGRYVFGFPALVGGVILAVIGAFHLVFAAVVITGPGNALSTAVASEMAWEPFVAHRDVQGIGIDTLMYLVAATALFVCAWRLCRWAAYRFACIGSPVPEDRRPAGMYAAPRALLGGVALAAAAVLIGVNVLVTQCQGVGYLPGWLTADRFNILSVACESGYEHSVLMDIVVVGALLGVGIPAIRRGSATRSRSPLARDGRERRRTVRAATFSSISVDPEGAIPRPG